MTDRITLRYNGIEESLECYSVEQTDWSEEEWTDSEHVTTTLCGLPTIKDDRGVTSIDSTIFQTTRGGKRGEYHGVSQAMADPRCENNEEYPKRYFNHDESGIEVVEIERGVDDG